MVVELAAVRLLAPWFGASLVVWTNVIGVILLGLAIGYSLGGSGATRATPLSTLSWVLFGAGAFVAWLPALGGACASLFLPTEIALHEAAELVGWGSLAVSLLVFLPPATLLGMVCPLAVESIARSRHSSAGSAGGAVLSISTLGSLAGVFGTSHWLLPALGLKYTFFLAGGCLLGAGVAARVLAAREAGARRRAPAGLVLLGLASFASRPGRPALPGQVIELARAESSYQSVRVVEDRSRDPVLRFLQVNEGFDSFQSVWQERAGVLPEGFYYNDFLLPLAWSEAARGAHAPWRGLVLGLGAGTVLRVFDGVTAVESEFIGVELDPAVVDMGREFFDLRPDDQRRQVWTGLDARVALRVARGSFDQVLLDCYSNQVEIPAHLCTLEFFREVRERLAPGGWFSANLGGFDLYDPVVEAVARTCAVGFETPALLVRVPSSRNFMLFTRRDAALPWSAELGLAEPDGTLLGRLGARALPGFARVLSPGEPGPILRDDRCQIEQLQLRSLREARQRRSRGTGV